MNELKEFDADRVFLNFETVLGGHILLYHGEDYGLTEECFENGLIIDALAAKILTDIGIDVGIEGFGEKIPIKFQYLPDDDNYIIAQEISVFNIGINEKTRIVSLAASDFGKADMTRNA